MFGTEGDGCSCISGDIREWYDVSAAYEADRFRNPGFAGIRRADDAVQSLLQING